MAQRDRDSHTGRNLALAGGTALLFWLLLRSKGWGLGLGMGSGVGLGAAGQGANVTPTNGEPPTNGEAPAPCRVWIRGDHIDVDGTRADLPTVVARCRAAGRADVHATGDTIVRTISEIVRAIQDAGVVVYAPPDMWRSVWAGIPPARTP
jgi:hypothetical protein